MMNNKWYILELLALVVYVYHSTPQFLIYPALTWLYIYVRVCRQLKLKSIQAIRDELLQKQGTSSLRMHQHYVSVASREAYWKIVLILISLCCSSLLVLLKRILTWSCLLFLVSLRGLHDNTRRVLRECLLIPHKNGIPPSSISSNAGTNDAKLYRCHFTLNKQGSTLRSKCLIHVLSAASYKSVYNIGHMLTTLLKVSHLINPWSLIGGTKTS